MVTFLKQKILLLCLLAVTLSPVLAVFSSTTALAAAENPETQLEKWLYYRGMRACFFAADFNATLGLRDGTISTSDINDGHVFPADFGVDQKNAGFGYLSPAMSDSDSGSLTCNDGSIFVRGAGAFGFNSPLQLICEMNRALPASANEYITPSDGVDCERSTEIAFKSPPGGDPSLFQRALTKALENGGSKDRPPFDLSENVRPASYDSGVLRYLLGVRSLEAFCGGSITSAKQSGNKDNKDVVVVDWVTADGKNNQDYLYAVSNTDRDRDSTVKDIYYTKDENYADDLTCRQMAALTRDNSNAYSTWAKANKDLAKQNEDNSQGGTTSSDEEQSTCAINGIGWIVCPVMIFIGEMNDMAYRFLDDLLQIRPAIITSQATQTAWSAVRDIANVAFVIAFMVIVYSQLTSAGISNYGVKKMLPRIVIAAILVNVSYVIAAIAVDLSNIAGAGVYSLLQNSYTPDLAQGSLDGAWKETIVGILAGTVAVAVGLLLAFTIGPMALVAFLLVMLILVARQALVLMLVIIAPLAFVAYLLPNTEDWFKKWYKAFVAVLMVYPIVGLVFGGSALAATVLSAVAAENADSSSLQIVALGVLAIPLFAVPAILKGSLSAAGSIGAKISGLADRAQKSATKDSSDRLGRRARVLEGKMAKRGGVIGAMGNYRARRDFRRNSAEKLAKHEQEAALSKHVLSNPNDRYSTAQIASAVASKQKMTKEDVDNSIALLHNDKPETLVPRAVEQLKDANRRGDVVAARAATQILTTQTGSRGVNEFHKAINEIEANGGLHSNVSEDVRADVSSAGLKGKDRALDTWSRFERSTDANGNPILDANGKQVMTTLTEHDSHIETARGLNEVELAGQSVDQLKKLVESGSMTQEQAARVLSSNKKGTIALDKAKLDIFQSKAGTAAGSGAQPATAGQSTPPNPPGVPGGSQANSGPATP